MQVALAKQVGDVYNQLASDGDALAASYFAKVTVLNAGYAYTVQTHRSEYDTQHTGADTQTIVHTIAGPTISVPWFAATDQTSEARAERCTGLLGIYAGLGFLQTNSNYGYPLGYGSLRGAGVGLERIPDASARFTVFGALYYYPVATGTYGPRTVTYGVTTFDGGIRWRPSAARWSVIAGLYQEQRTLHPGLRSGYMILVAPYFGLQF